MEGKPMRPLPAHDWYLLEPRPPHPAVCEHGRPDHQVILRQLAEALGLDLPALPMAPAQVWEGLLVEVERVARCQGAGEPADPARWAHVVSPPPLLG